MAREIVQPFPAPRTVSEYLALKPKLTDTTGAPVVSAWCERCRTTHFTVEPHCDEVQCPACGSTASRCLRPSGHDAVAWHVQRIQAFDSLRDELVAAGVPQVARWPHRA